MKIKKDILLSFALVVLTGCLLFAGKPASGVTGNNKTRCKVKTTCCLKSRPAIQKPETPWNFLTEGLLHISA